MPKKILIFRSVAVVSMGYVVNDTVKEFGPDVEITILTRTENAYVMKEIRHVKSIIPYYQHSFNFKEVIRQQLTELQKHQFNLAIVPVNGNPDSYDNVINFCIKVFINTPVYYYNTTLKKFIEYRRSNTRNALKQIARLASLVCCMILAVFYLSVILFLFLRNFVHKIINLVTGSTKKRLITC